jgi:hypothetical protein
MPCNERDRLLEDYSDAVLHAASAADALAQAAGTSPLVDYTPLVKAQETAKAAASKMRLAYEQHLAEHKCAFLKEKPSTQF